jgi:hypothetical protein
MFSQIILTTQLARKVVQALVYPEVLGPILSELLRIIQQPVTPGMDIMGVLADQLVLVALQVMAARAERV